MAHKPYLLQETTWKTVQETEYEVAILPWGATEAHNYHLPYGSDIIESSYIAEESARRAWEQGANVIALPTVPFGVNTGQIDIPLTINMNPSTQMAVLQDVLESLYQQQKIDKLVIFNSHGGNSFKQMIRELYLDYPDIYVFMLNWYEVVDWSKYFTDMGDHAGEMETSVMMHIAPELVLPLEKAGDGRWKDFKFKAKQEKWVWTQREWSKASKDTGIGNPKRATTDKGEKYLNETIDKIVEFLAELAHTNTNEMYEDSP
jgi:creatinine amidohydrolase